MKKIIFGVFVLMMSLITTDSIYAQNQAGNEIQKRDQDQISEPTGPATRTRVGENAQDDSEVLQMETKSESNQSDQSGNGSSGGLGTQYLKSTEQVMNNIRETVQTRTNNPEAGEQVTNMIQNQISIRNMIEAKLTEIEERPALVKMILGPDYKNAGEVKMQIDALKLQLVQMTQLREQLRVDLDSDEIGVVDDGIETIENSITYLESDLEEGLAGFSLFGWLNKLLSGYIE